ncbi:MAG: hypothetical protein LWY06_02275 [Firmicutes bacterium]|nr:hypothetical protein [Bacillota bacterium]
MSKKETPRSLYLKNLCKQFWEYKDNEFADKTEYFDGDRREKQGPPVFKKEYLDRNIICMESENRKALINKIPPRKRHRWFGSMKSSQALAQSFFANMEIYNNLCILSDLADGDGIPLFENLNWKSNNFRMELEKEVNSLGEPRPTSIDVFFDDGEYRIAIECKLSEDNIGFCSRPGLKQSESNYCDGSYKRQKGRKNRCSLSEENIKYWDFIPEIFSWKEQNDLTPCPLYKTYQLSRNILSVCVKDKKCSVENGHVIMIYDENNPSFQSKGSGMDSFRETTKSLNRNTLLRKCSWQRILGHIRGKGILPQLTRKIGQKYGF